MTNLDELRQIVLDKDEPGAGDFGEIAAGTQTVDDGRIFGLNAVERMFLSMGLFMVVTVTSVLLLLVTSSVALP